MITSRRTRQKKTSKKDIAQQERQRGYNDSQKGLPPETLDDDSPYTRGYLQSAINKYDISHLLSDYDPGD